MAFGSAVVSAGLVGELVYRGVAIKALAGRGLPEAVAVVVASLPFVFVHGLAPIKMPVLVPYVGFGIVLGIVFVLSGSLLPGMALPGAYNALAIVRGTRNADVAGATEEVGTLSGETDA